MQILKPSKLQFSCTCLQYEFDLNQLEEVLEHLRKRGFKVERK